MSWQLYVRSAEAMLQSGKLPSSEEIISLIKRVNPTSLNLSEGDREHGYAIKNRLQNLLLENYGETFHLAPHPYSSDIILIKHNALPSIDACHADIKALSQEALDTVSDAPAQAVDPAKAEAKARLRKQPGGTSPKETLRNAEMLVEQYEYPQAEEMLASIRITETKDLPTLVRAAGILAEEMGAYPKALAVLLAQPRQVLKDKGVRELLALTYYGNGMIPEARALLDAAHESDLSKTALCAYADISLKDGNLAKANYLVKLSEQREGFVTAYAGLKKEIEAAMLCEAAPLLQEAEEAFNGSDLDGAERSLQKALALYPSYHKAQQLAGAISARKTASEVAMLWEALERTDTAPERLDLLTQLLERDGANRDKISSLLDGERSRQKREAVEAALADLGAIAAKEKWGECFDILLRLSRQGDEDILRRACQLAPHFSALPGSHKLLKLPDEEAKELWLRLVRLLSPAQHGPAEGDWGQIQHLNQYFHRYPLFREQYHRALEMEQAKARDEVERLLLRMYDLGEMEQTEDGAALAEVKRLYTEVRKRLAILPAEESAARKEEAETLIAGLGPANYDDPGILDYQAAMLLGNVSKALQMRESFASPAEQGLLKMVDDNIAAEFAISAEPMPLVFSPHGVVDLANESAPPVLEYLCSSDRHLLFREDDQTVVVVNLERMSATRHRSPKFEEVAVMDMLPDKDLFLFINTATNNTVWRAILSETESRFTAEIQINEHFVYGEQAELRALFMSTTRQNAYYALFKDCEGVRFMKQSIGLSSNVERTYPVAGDSAAAFRLSYQPDRFVIVTDSNTTVLESNLTPTRGCSKVGSEQSLNCLGIDRGRSQMYALGDGVVSVVNTKLRAVKQYLKAASVAHVTVVEPAGVCVEKNTAILNVAGNGRFYNFETNKFSQRFSLSRIVHTAPPSRWYYWDFDPAQGALILKDLTEEVDTLLEWQVLLSADQDEAAVIQFVDRLADPDFFTFTTSASTGQGQESEGIQSVSHMPAPEAATPEASLRD